MEDTYIKHMAFAVRDAHAALRTYQDLLGSRIGRQSPRLSQVA